MIVDLNAFREALACQDWVVLDTETTGANRDRDDQAVQIAILKPDGEAFTTLVTPTIPVDPGAERIHGIDAARLRSAPRLGEIPDLYPLLFGKIVVAYNAGFDLEIMQHTCRAHAMMEMEWIDWACAMLVYAEYRGEWDERHGNNRWHKLTDACAYEGITVKDAHDALGDCRMTLALIQKMLAR